MAAILQPTPRNLRRLRRLLRLGGLAAIPTETVYGLAANALDERACRRIFEVKGRPPADPLICHIAWPEQVATIARTNPLAEALAARFWPGPLTLVLPKLPVVPDIVTSALDSVALRLPAHSVFRALAEGLDFPLAAPSANPFAYISPTNAAHVQSGLGDRIAAILDGGPCRLGLESTIVDVRDPERPRLLRYGALDVESIEAAAGRPVPPAAPRSGSGPGAGGAEAAAPAIAPGALPKHYSPARPLVVSARPLDRARVAGADLGTGFLFLAKPDFDPGPYARWLSPKGELEVIAGNLYAALRELDALPIKRILAEEAPELGLGKAINDRLRRAGHP